MAQRQGSASAIKQRWNVSVSKYICINPDSCGSRFLHFKMDLNNVLTSSKPGLLPPFGGCVLKQNGMELLFVTLSPKPSFQAVAKACSDWVSASLIKAILCKFNDYFMISISTPNSRQIFPALLNLRCVPSHSFS